VDFKILHKDQDSKARRGELALKRGKISTPVFMPVATRGAIRALSLKDLAEINFEIILGNTYHLYLRPGLSVLEQAKGLHNFINFHRPILTDSGGFQVFSLAKLFKIHDQGVEFRSHLDGSKHFFDPQKVLDIQKIIGSDIMMVLDQCADYPASEKLVSEAVKRTVNWAELSKVYWQDRFSPKEQTLFAIVQGGVFPKLRKECSQRLIDLDFPGYAIGGLSVGEPKNLYQEITEFTLELFPENQPKYMMGVGSPIEILEAVKCGVDMFDCVMPTRIARNGTLYTSEGRVNIKAAQYENDFSPLDKNCDCFVCQSYSRSYLRHLFKVGEISSLIYNTYHNLYFMKKFMLEIQKSISEHKFIETYQKWKNLYRERI